MIDLSHSETLCFEHRDRYEYVCRIIGWTTEGRWIGRLLIATPEGISIHALSRKTRIPRPTIRRRVRQLVECGAVVRKEHRAQITKIGVGYWVSLHREINEICYGQRVGMSAPVINALRLIGITNEDRLAELAKISFPHLEKAC